MMKQIFLLLSTLIALNGTAQRIVPAHVGFVFPLSTNGTNAPNCTNTFSLHALAGVSKNEKAFCVSGIATSVRDTVTGLILSGVVNNVGKNATGAEIAGVVNRNGHNCIGVQIAGVVNVTDSITGLQVAGLCNVGTGKVQGAQFAGFANISCDANAQFAGFYNQATKIDGVQASGFINLAKDVKGTQMAGFINKARRVSGVQLAGFINIADSSEYPVALINIIKNGEKSIGIMADNTGYTYATLRSGSKTMYGLLGLGINATNTNILYSLQGGIGAQLQLSKHFRLKGEISSSSVTNFKSDWGMQSGLRLLPSLKLGIIELYAGPALNLSIFETTSAATFHTANPIWTYNKWCKTYEFFIGGMAGVQIHF